MKKYLIKYALGGGFGGIEMADGEILEFNNQEEALDYAYEMACQEYDGYAGLHGIRDIDQIMEEDGCDEYEAEQEYNDDRESWVDYEATEIKED